jgi:hypothetical protein
LSNLDAFSRYTYSGEEVNEDWWVSFLAAVTLAAVSFSFTLPKLLRAAQDNDAIGRPLPKSVSSKFSLPPVRPREDLEAQIADVQINETCLPVHDTFRSRTEFWFQTNRRKL